MKHKHLLFALSLGLTAMAPEVLAVGTFVVAPQRKDMVYDDARDVVFITHGDRVLRYHVGSGAFLPPIMTGGALAGIDLSPDGNTIAVADGVNDGAKSIVYLVPVRPISGTGYLRPRKFTTPNAFYEGEMHSIAYASDGTIRTTATIQAGSATLPMRRLDPATRTWTTLATVQHATMLSASGDRDTIAFAEAGVSNGPWGYLDIPSAQVIRSTFFQGTSTFNYEIAADRLGGQFAIPTYAGTYIFNDTFQQIATIGGSGGPYPIGAAYHPVRQVAYFPSAQTREVRVYDMQTFTQTGSYDFEHDFIGLGRAYQQGRTRLSRDGSLLMVSVDGGVRLLRMYAPLQASPVSFTAVQGNGAGSSTTVPLPGSIGNGDPLTYSLGSAPQNGQAAVFGELLTYTPRSGFTGTDTFTYRVHYGSASREAQINVQVVAASSRVRVTARPLAGTMRHALMTRDTLPRSLGVLATRARLDP